MIHTTYNVKLDAARYDIVVGKNLLPGTLVENLNRKTKNKKVVVVFDSFLRNTPLCRTVCAALKQHGYEAYPYRLRSGKQNKNIQNVIDLYEFLEIKGLSRDSTLVAFGGGVVGDLVGFVASTYLRGINFINIPTTLMAMVDSSIGGKVAVNFHKRINAIGNYYHPMVNIIDLDFLKSLPERDFWSGLAEIIKCAAIADAKLFEYLRTHVKEITAQREQDLFYIMSRAIEIKLDHVKGDVREQGKRLKLNYGHTLGHAVEISTEHADIYRHGEGVSLGMVGAAYIAEKYFKKRGVLKAHEDILSKYGLPVAIDTRTMKNEYRGLLKRCIENVQRDKKKKNNRLRFVLCRNIGQCGVYSDIRGALVENAFRYLIHK